MLTIIDFSSPLEVEWFSDAPKKYIFRWIHWYHKCPSTIWVRTSLVGGKPSFTAVGDDANLEWKKGQFMVSTSAWVDVNFVIAPTYSFYKHLCTIWDYEDGSHSKLIIAYAHFMRFMYAATGVQCCTSSVLFWFSGFTIFFWFAIVTKAKV